jgi:Putative lumazine-binding
METETYKMSKIHKQSEGNETQPEVTRPVQQYFDLLYTSDLELFDRVFDDQAQLYGLADGTPVVWPAAKYRAIIKGRESPQALGARREEEILELDFASATQAFAKVRVRINNMVFIDYLTALKLTKGWRVVSKTYHLLQD